MKLWQKIVRYFNPSCDRIGCPNNSQAFGLCGNCLSEMLRNTESENREKEVRKIADGVKLALREIDEEEILDPDAPIPYEITALGAAYLDGYRIGLKEFGLKPEQEAAK